jgi:hypothetical protein
MADEKVILEGQTLDAGTGVGGAKRLRFESQPAAPTSGQLSSAAINAAGVGDNTLVAAVALQTVRVFRLFLVAAAAVVIKFKDGAGTDLTGPISLGAGGGIVLDFDGEPWFKTSAGNAFILNLSGAVQVSGRIYYQQSA